MGLLTLFLHHRKSWLGISKVSLTSLEGLGLLSATSILGLCYAYPTPTLRPCYDIATTYERRRNVRPTNDGGTTLLCVGFLKDNKNLSLFIQIKIISTNKVVPKMSV